jgi:hypothetical protein
MSASCQHGHHWSLWKRAILHGLKTLVRRHPVAALQAAGSSIAYAGREVVRGGGEFIREKLAVSAHGLEQHRLSQKTDRADKRSQRRVSKRADKALLNSLRPEDRRALVRLAGESGQRGR